MKTLRAVAFHLISVVVLGSLGFLGWLWSDQLLFSVPFWTADPFGAWCIALVVTGLFLTFACLPIQFVTSRARTHWAVLAGFLSGPLFVSLLLVLRDEPPSLRNYLVAPGVLSLHLLFAAIGVLFAIGFRRYGPNHSFKPTPLRGAA
jgi:hypothetical protein